MPDERRSFDDLARHLTALASPTRLELLHALRAPLALHEIRVTPTLTREGENEERPLSRQAVTRHLDQLVEDGLVVRTAATPRARGDGFVLNHERLFAVVDELRALARLRPIADAAPVVSGTMVGEPREATLPPPPRLAVAFGRDDGVAFSLSKGERWRIGRSPGCEIRLDYDPFVSSEHAVLHREPSGTYRLRDLGSRNGSCVNWERIDPSAPRDLRAGDLVTFGRSVLVFQA